MLSENKLMMMMMMMSCVDGKIYHWNSTCHGSLITYNAVY